MGRKHCGKRRNCSLQAISPFPSVFKRLVSQGHQKVSLCGNGLKHCGTRRIMLSSFNPKTDLAIGATCKCWGRKEFYCLKVFFNADRFSMFFFFFITDPQRENQQPMHHHQTYFTGIITDDVAVHKVGNISFCQIFDTHVFYTSTNKFCIYFVVRKCFECLQV